MARKPGRCRYKAAGYDRMKFRTAIVVAGLLALTSSSAALAQRSTGTPPAETSSGGGRAPIQPQPAGGERQTTPAAQAVNNYPGNPRLEASSRRLDLRIKRGICTGC